MSPTMSLLARPLRVGHTLSPPELDVCKTALLSSALPSISRSGTRHCARSLTYAIQRSPWPQTLHARDSAESHRHRTLYLPGASRSSNRPCSVQNPPHSLVAAYTTTSSRRASPSSSLPSQRASPAALTPERYHELSDTYIESLLLHLETLAEEREDVEVEYAAGVLTLSIEGRGTYVLNKQPPNKQIWLSSPISGPKRYDYVLGGHEGKGGGQWVYLRDGSILDSLLEAEIGIKVGDVVSVD